MWGAVPLRFMSLISRAFFFLNREESVARINTLISRWRYCSSSPLHRRTNHCHCRIWIQKRVKLKLDVWHDALSTEWQSTLGNIAFRFYIRSHHIFYIFNCAKFCYKIFCAIISLFMLDLLEYAICTPMIFQRCEITILYWFFTLHFKI